MKLFSRNLPSVALVVLFLAVAASAAAASVIPKQLVPEACTLAAIRADAGGCTICHLAVLTMNLTNFLVLALALPAAVLLTAIGGITLLISGGSPKLVTQGKTTLTYTFGGLLIVLLAWLAVDTIIKVITLDQRNFRGTFGRPWYQLPIDQCNIR